MNYDDFVAIVSHPRMNRYLYACNQDKDKALKLYRLNLKLCQETYIIISCFEVAIRNKINIHYTAFHGAEWIKNSIQATGMFAANNNRGTRSVIQKKLKDLGEDYTAPKLVAEMDFGFWMFLFANPQFIAAGNMLLQILPHKPATTRTFQANNAFIYDQLNVIRKCRNRIAHNEPLCFQLNQPIIDTQYITYRYQLIRSMFQWMNIDPDAYLKELDYVTVLIQKINQLLTTD